MAEKGPCFCATSSLISREEQNIMAQIEKTAKLVRLSDTELTIANPAEDIRDRTVVDRDGEDIGEVEDLLIDAHEKRVRLLEVASGGFLGLGKTKFLLPVEAITRISVSGCVKMLENRSFENAGCALGSRRCENAGLQRE